MKKAGISLFVILLFIISISRVKAQSGSYNQWLDHLPYNNCKAIAEAGNLMYAATPYSIFYFNKSDNSLNRLNKVTPDGLSDIGISSIAYSSPLSTLVVAYSNTNIDLVKGSVVINIPDIKRKQILGNKTINSIFIKDKLAYLACGFGIVVLDIEKEEIKDTYYIGPSGSQINVLAITYHQADDKFYAATEKGLYSAPSTSNLAFYVNWEQDNSFQVKNSAFNMVASFSGKIFVNKKGSGSEPDTLFVQDGNQWSDFIPYDHSTRMSMRISGEKLLIGNGWSVSVFSTSGDREAVYSSYNPGNLRPGDAILDKDNKLWVADIEQGLWSIGSDNVGSNYIFNGPVSPVVAAMDVSGKQLWVVPGGRSAGFAYLYTVPKIYTLAEGTWRSYDWFNTPDLLPVRDILCVAADPNDPNHAFLGTWGYGLLEFDNGELIKMYDTSNSTLQYHVGYGYGNLRVGGVAFDKDNNLWVTNSNVANILSMRKPTGEWKSYNLSSLWLAPPDIGNIVIDKENQKWMQCRDLSLAVFSDNNTPDNPNDDKMKKVTNALGNGNLPGSGISSMAVDRDGQLWLGTDQGVAVIYSPGNVFDGGNYDAQQIMVEEAGYLHPLLETENITAIAINGNNEKWLGTDKAGVFLMSADGTTELLHFSEADSPLLSNSIQSIKIASNGEVYFGTSLGIVSYKDYKVEAPLTLDSLFIYPNPVRPEYRGPVYISNLVEESNVKISDVSGALVWETQAQGGQVIWDGNNLDGHRVNTGVYLVFVTNPDGTKKKASKVLFVR